MKTRKHPLSWRSGPYGSRSMESDQIYPKPHALTTITPRSEKIKQKHDRKLAGAQWIRKHPYALNPIQRIARLHEQPEYPYSWEDLITRLLSTKPTFIRNNIKLYSTQHILRLLHQPNNLPKHPQNTPIKQAVAARLMNRLRADLHRDLDRFYPTIMHDGVRHLSSTHLELMQYGYNPLTSTEEPPNLTELKKHEMPLCPM